MAEPMADERVTEIVRAATHGKAIVLGGLVRDAAHIDAEKKEEIRKAIGTVWIHGVRELAREVRRLRAQLEAVDQFIDAWQDGADPGDTLRAIRDQLAGKTPGGDGD